MATIKESDILLPEDIGEVLRDSGVAVDINKPWTFFSSDLNMWSKKKPVVKATMFIPMSTWKSTGWKGDDGKCGLTIPTYTSPASLRSAMANGSAGWSYTPPNGTSAQRRRLGDFRGYYTEAVNPVGGMAGSYILRSTTTGYEFDIDIEIVVQTSDYNLTLGDISVNGVKLTDMYMGVYLLPTSGSGYYWGGTTSKIGSNGELTMTAKGNSGLTGEFRAFVFLSTASQANGEASGTFISINKPEQIINIASSETMYLINVSAVAVEVGGKQYYYELFIRNNTGASKTFTNIYVRIQHYIDGSWQNEGTAQLVKSSATVAAGATSLVAQGTLTHSVAFGLNDLESGYFRIYAYSTSPDVTGTPTPIEPPMPEE